MILLDEGKIIYDGTLHQLHTEAVDGRKQVEFEFLAEISKANLPIQKMSNGNKKTLLPGWRPFMVMNSFNLN